MHNAKFTIFGVKIGPIKQISQLIIKPLVVDARVETLAPCAVGS